MDTASIKVALDSFLENKVAKLNKNHKLMICAAVVLVPVLAFYFVFYSPNTQTISSLERGITSLQGQIRAAKIQAAKLDEQQAEMKAVEADFKKASELIPDNREIPSLLTNISSEATGAGLDMLSFKPGHESPKDFYAEISVALKVNGSFNNIGHFLDTVSKLPRIVNLANMNLASPKMKNGEMVLGSSINLVTYKFIEPVKGKGAKK
jgi:type IV pilus assembly protein PilO